MRTASSPLSMDSQLRQPLIISASPQMAEILALVGRVAAGDAKVLITGESGVGKDLVAREIHSRSAARHSRLRRRELRRPHRNAARVGAVRSRQGQLHRRVSRQARQAAARATRHALPRRSRRDEPAHAGAAAAVPRERRNSGGRCRSIARRRVDVRVIAATNRNLPSWSRPVSSAKTCCTGCASSTSTCRRCASARGRGGAVQHMIAKANRT